MKIKTTIHVRHSHGLFPYKAIIQDKRILVTDKEGNHQAHPDFPSAWYSYTFTRNMRGRERNYHIDFKNSVDGNHALWINKRASIGLNLWKRLKMRWIWFEFKSLSGPAGRLWEFMNKPLIVGLIVTLIGLLAAYFGLR